jgi:hypothetical protein
MPVFLFSNSQSGAPALPIQSFKVHALPGRFSSACSKSRSFFRAKKRSNNYFKSLGATQDANTNVNNGLQEKALQKNGKLNAKNDQNVPLKTSLTCHFVPFFATPSGDSKDRRKRHRVTRNTDVEV